MGVKEDGLPVRLIKGYFGAMRPTQTNGGNCPLCGGSVWIDWPLESKQKFLRTVVMHFGCANSDLVLEL